MSLSIFSLNFLLAPFFLNKNHTYAVENYKFWQNICNVRGKTALYYHEILFEKVVLNTLDTTTRQNAPLLFNN